MEALGNATGPGIPPAVYRGPRLAFHAVQPDPTESHEFCVRPVQGVTGLRLAPLSTSRRNAPSISLNVYWTPIGSLEDADWISRVEFRSTVIPLWRTGSCPGPGRPCAVRVSSDVGGRQVETAIPGKIGRFRARVAQFSRAHLGVLFGRCAPMNPVV